MLSFHPAPRSAPRTPLRGVFFQPTKRKLHMSMMFEEVRRVGRKPRRPTHTFVLKQKPYTIQPFLLAPVLPGETLKNLLLQSRVVTDPIKHPLIGWWCEYYFFYVKHRDMDGSDDFQAMMLDLEHSLASYVPSATNAKYYQYDDNGGIDWVGQCLKRVVEEYFRDEGEAWNNVTIDSMPAAAINSETWLQSAFDATTIDPGDTLGDIDTASPSDIPMETLDRARRTWEFMRANQLTNASYEDYLRTYGVRGQLVAPKNKPELIRYVRDWTYPTNTIDPTDGSAASAVSWAITERADKDRFFAEPGFIFGVSVVRPKVYLAKQKASLAQWLDNALAWMPAIMRDDPASSLRKFTSTTGPLAGNVTNGYWVDLRDLFLYGDQFANYDLDAATDGTNAIDLPTTALQHKYPTEAMVDLLFAADTAEYVRQDGVCSLNILSVETDATP